MPKLVAPIVAGEADMVVGDRQVGQIDHFSGSKKGLQRLGSWVVRRLSGTEVTDTTSGFRAYNREAALQLLGRRQLHLHAGEPDPGRQDAGRGRPGRGRDQPADARVAAVRLDRRLRAPQRAGDPAHLRPLRAAARLRHRRRSSSSLLALAAWLPFLIDWIFNGDSTGHIQSLILGAVLFIAAVQLFALGVIGDLLAGQRVMTQRVFERVRRVELALGVEPSHYERGAEARSERGGGRRATPAARRRSSADYGKTASFLAVGVGLTGLITYAYFLIASHVLSKPDYGQITVLWSAVFITISTLYRPIEQLLSRHISERLVKGEPIGQPMRVASTIQLGLSLFFAVVALALRGPIQNGLLEGNETLYWVFFSSVLFYAASYFARGFLAGQQRFGLFVALILSESCFRTIFAVLVAVGVLSGQSAVAIGITAAPA